MDRDREIGKLTNVLRRIARASAYAAWSRDADGARFCVLQYNKVLARLGELEPAIAPLFAPLAEGASAELVRMTAQGLANYFQDEARERTVRIGVRLHGCGRRGAWAGGVRIGSCR